MNKFKQVRKNIYYNIYSIYDPNPLAVITVRNIATGLHQGSMLCHILRTQRWGWLGWGVTRPQWFDPLHAQLLLRKVNITGNLLILNNDLNHWGRVTNICLIGSNNSLMLNWCQTVIYINVGLLLIWHFWTKFNDISIKINKNNFIQ